MGFAMDTELEIYMQRLDVMCSVAEQQLVPGGKPTKSDLRNLYNAALKVITAYQKEKNGKLSDDTGKLS